MPINQVLSIKCLSIKYYQSSTINQVLGIMPIKPKDPVTGHQKIQLQDSADKASAAERAA